MITKYTFFPEHTRGSADYGWLQAKYSFSFGQFYNPRRQQFGKLRVLNDDIVQAGKGFGMHRHQNMEIVTIPLKGKLVHKDSLGHESIIDTGEIQVMSAGSGIQHSEYNASDTDVVNLLQIWIFPNKENVVPRYAQKAFDFSIKDEWVTIVQPKGAKGRALWVHQEVYFNVATLSTDSEMTYALRNLKHVIYIFVIKGSIRIGNQYLKEKDALGIETKQNIDISAEQESRILLIEVIQ